MPQDAHVVVTLVSALLVQETDGVHQLMYHRALLCGAAWYLKVDILSTADPAHAAPATAVAGRDPNIIVFLASVWLEPDTCVSVIVFHRVVYQLLLLRICDAITEEMTNEVN